MRQTGIVGIFVLVLILVIAVAGGTYYLGRVSTKSPHTKIQQPSQITQTIPAFSPSSQTTPSSTLTPTQNSTANWKTYENTNYGFTIKTPPQYFFQENANNKALISLMETNPNPNREFGLGFDIKLSKAPSGSYSILEQFGSTGDVTYSNSLFIKNKTPQSITLGGKKGYVMRDIGAGVAGILKEIVLINDNNLYNVQIGGSWTEKEDEADQILSTFKFTN